MSTPVNLDNIYYRDIKRSECDPLHKDEVRRLVVIAQKGYDKDKKTWTPEALEARDKIILSHLRLVVLLVRKHLDSTNSSFMDCLNECYLAVLRCIIKYDIEGKTQFQSYLNTAVKFAVMGFMDKSSRTVRLPYNEIRRRQRNKEAMLNEEGCLDKLLRAQFKPVNNMRSLDAPQDPSIDLYETIFVEEEARKKVFDKEMKKIAYEALDRLNDRERKIIEKRFMSDKKSTLEQLSVEHGLTRERIRQIEKASLRKMRVFINSIKKERGYVQS